MFYIPILYLTLPQDEVTDFVTGFEVSSSCSANPHELKERVHELNKEIIGSLPVFTSFSSSTGRTTIT